MILYPCRVGVGIPERGCNSEHIFYLDLLLYVDVSCKFDMANAISKVLFAILHMLQTGKAMVLF